MSMACSLRRSTHTPRRCGSGPSRSPRRGRPPERTRSAWSWSARRAIRGSTSMRSRWFDRESPPDSIGRCNRRATPRHLHSAAMTPHPDAGAGTWVVLPTYDEAENLPGISAAILAALPSATLLVVDDTSPDGTGELADRMAAEDARIRVRHRPGKAGLGRAYLDGFRVALDGGASSVIQ